jgi:hypothetical protein
VLQGAAGGEREVTTVAGDPGERSGGAGKKLGVSNISDRAVRRGLN